MQTRALETGRFESTAAQEFEVTHWRRSYDALVELLGCAGTEVSTERTLETDKDIEPHSFVRKAWHVFIFPPQTVELVTDIPEVIDPTPDYKLGHESKRYQYNESLVKGKLEVTYDDAGGRIIYTIRDMLGDSELNDSAREAVELSDLPIAAEQRHAT